MSVPKPNELRAWSSKSTFPTSLFSRRESFFSSSFDKMMKPYAEYHRVYGGGADEWVDRRGGTGGSSVRPWGSVNLRATEEESVVPPWRCRVLLHAPRRLGNRVPTRRRRRRWLGRWRPLLLGEETCGFLPHDCSTLLSNKIPGFNR
jgi:hypothetical protein